MGRRGTTAAFAAALTGLVAAAPAQANDFQRVYNDYKKDGAIEACRWSAQELANADKQTPPDVEQYAPSFLDALEAARDRQPNCDNKNKTQAAPTATAPSAPAPPPASSTPAPAVTTTTPAATPPPAPVAPANPTVQGVPSPPLEKKKREESTPAPVWLLAGLGALAGLAALLAIAAWWFGWSAERFTRPARASLTEFGDRLADWSFEFRDWVRTGR